MGVQNARRHNVTLHFYSHRALHNRRYFLFAYRADTRGYARERIVFVQIGIENEKKKNIVKKKKTLYYYTRICILTPATHTSHHTMMTTVFVGNK